MMRFARMVLLSTLAFSAVAAHAASCHSTPADETQIENLVNQIFVAAKTNDLKLWHDSITPDYSMFDTGHRYSGDEIMGALKKAQDAGHVFVWEPTAFHVQADCQIGWFTEINVGSVDGEPTTWLESGAVRKVDGRWRLSFFESEREITPKPKSGS
jgi:hypothetical protein